MKASDEGSEARPRDRQGRAADWQVYVLIGLVVGFLTGLWWGWIGGAVSAWLDTVQPSTPGPTPLIARPLLTALMGALVGSAAGAVVSWAAGHGSARKRRTACARPPRRRRNGGTDATVRSHTH